MSRTIERDLITNATIDGVLCIRDYYLENKQDRTIVCAQCIHDDIVDSYANYNFVSRHCAIVRLSSDFSFINCVRCNKILSKIELLRVTPCSICASVVREFLATRTAVELRELVTGTSAVVIVIYFRRYHEFP